MRPQAEIRKLQAQFEYYTLVTAGRKALQFYSYSLERFLGTYPELRKPQDFLHSHFEDYLRKQERAGFSATKLNLDLRVIRQFWQWMIRTKDLLLVDITSATKNVPIQKRNRRVTLEELTRLSREIRDPRLLNCVEMVILGGKPNKVAAQCGISYHTAWRLFRDACVRAELEPLSLYALRNACKQTALEILSENLCAQARDTLIQEPQSFSDSLSNIEVST